MWKDLSTAPGPFDNGRPGGYFYLAAAERNSFAPTPLWKIAKKFVKGLLKYLGKEGGRR